MRAIGLCFASILAAAVACSTTSDDTPTCPWSCNSNTDENDSCCPGQACDYGYGSFTCQGGHFKNAYRGPDAAAMDAGIPYCAAVERADGTCDDNDGYCQEPADAGCRAIYVCESLHLHFLRTDCSLDAGQREDATGVLGDADIAPDAVADIVNDPAID